jgi:FkbM family methyltransferase
LPSNVARLRENVALNRLGNVTIHQAAMGSRESRARFGAVRAPGESGWGSLSVPRDERTEEIEVEVVTLDGLVARLGIDRLDLMKLDIQGGERDALLGGRDAIARFRPDIVCEAAEGCSWQYGYDVAGLLRFARELGYRVSAFGRRGRLVEVGGDEVPGPTLLLRHGARRSRGRG